MGDEDELRAKYAELMKCMAELSISTAECEAFETMLATILHIGNVVFVTDTSDTEKLCVRGVRALVKASALLGASSPDRLARVMMTSVQVNE